MDLQYVKVYAVDNKGRVVPDTKDEVTFKVSGAARLIAVDNGDHFTDELFTGNTKKLHKGFIMAILRSGPFRWRGSNNCILQRIEGCSKEVGYKVVIGISFTPPLRPEGRTSQLSYLFFL